MPLRLFMSGIFCHGLLHTCHTMGSFRHAAMACYIPATQWKLQTRCHGLLHTCHTMGSIRHAAMACYIPAIQWEASGTLPWLVTYLPYNGKLQARCHGLLHTCHTMGSFRHAAMACYIPAIQWEASGTLHMKFIFLALLMTPGDDAPPLWQYRDKHISVYVS